MKEMGQKLKNAIRQMDMALKNGATQKQIYSQLWYFLEQHRMSTVCIEQLNSQFWSDQDLATGMIMIPINMYIIASLIFRRLDLPALTIYCATLFAQLLGGACCLMPAMICKQMHAPHKIIVRLQLGLVKRINHSDSILLKLKYDALMARLVSENCPYTWILGQSHF